MGFSICAGWQTDSTLDRLPTLCRIYQKVEFSHETACGPSKNGKKKSEKMRKAFTNYSYEMMA